ncbi:Lin1244/Lin1753 domain-containing protein [Chryseobacterium sp. EO14]|uniref:Lin1244/Lin1753 domain-containing protein n=1 Tax=Chryseobacterium sp. EO14 TaxID=2950551 RepID=UPI00210B7A91|nr:Lin1244/Lin1753 domain-containing protein [Chryseobacterium sp. EO14]MCQ4139199.1 DUF4373 domain-containing protein [Chryseobacterium sp. EO14]
MARPIKKGLDYFPLNTNIESNDKMQLIESEFGSKGFAIVVKLFCKIYAENGYYYPWTEEKKLLFAKKTGESVGLVDEIVKRSVKWGIFDEFVFNQFHVLTSKGIQSRFLEAVTRRGKVEILSELLLIDINVYKNAVNVNINSVNDDNSTQSKVNKSKVNKSNGAESPDGESSDIIISDEKKPTPPDEPKEKNNKIEKIDFVKLLQIINQNTGRNFQVINENTRKKFRARLKDGYTKETILTAIKNAPKTDYHKNNNCQYLTPEFFSRADSLDKYGNKTKVTEVKTVNTETPVGVWNV